MFPCFPFLSSSPRLLLALIGRHIIVGDYETNNLCISWYFLQLGTISKWGAVCIEPVKKKLACGDTGMGAMAEPALGPPQTPQ